MEDEYDDPADEYSEIDEAYDNCGKLRDGMCMLAGTEYCDFECPFRD